MIEVDIATGTCDGHVPEAPEVLTPAFFASLRGPVAQIPERLLMLAVLENAVICYRRYARARDSQARRWFEEARDWLASSERSSVFSFESICDALDLHPDYVRRNLSLPNGDRWRAPERARGLRVATLSPVGVAPSDLGTRRISGTPPERAGRADRRRRATVRDPSASRGHRPPRSAQESRADGRRAR